MSRWGAPVYHKYPWRPRAVSTAISWQRRRICEAIRQAPSDNRPGPATLQRRVTAGTAPADRAVSSEEGSGGGTGGPEAREHLANERTLLAWVRTGVSLISFGLVIERIGGQVGSVGTSRLFGVGLAVLGCLTLVMGTIQFLRSRRGISTGHFVPAT